MQGVEQDPLAVLVCALAALIDKKPGYQLQCCGVAVSFHEGCIYKTASPRHHLCSCWCQCQYQRPHQWWIVLGADPSKETTGFLLCCKENLKALKVSLTFFPLIHVCGFEILQVLDLSGCSCYCAIALNRAELPLLVGVRTLAYAVPCLDIHQSDTRQSDDT